MDLSKAFDTINHDLLIAKLHAYGFDKNSLNLMKSYLSNRWQRVKINTSFSSWSELIQGVPQGSILGPLLFNIFINDLFFKLLESGICNFADDNTLYLAAMRLDILMDRLERASKTALKWFEYNSMKLNAKKCHLLVCGHKFESMIAKIGSDNVIETHCVKLLGMSIDSKLTFENHINIICKKASKKLNALARQCRILPFYRRKMFINAFFKSQFSYCPPIWMFHSRSINAKINKLHFRALRMAYRDYSTTFEELLIKDESVTIHQQNLQSLAIEIYKVINELSPNFLKEIFVTNKNIASGNVSANTRRQAQFYNYNNLRRVSTGAETLRNLGPNIWELVPLDMKNVSSLSMFKTRIRNFKFKKCPCKLCKEYIPNLGFL